MIERRGCSVVEAENGEKAVSLAYSLQPDLILTDINLPLLDGLSVTRRIRQQASMRQVPIVAVTGNAAPEFQKEAQAAGCNHCLVKPIDFEAFNLLLAQLLTRKTKLTTLQV